MKAEFVDTSGFPAPRMQGWEPIVVKRAEIDNHVARPAAKAAPAHGIRSVRILHPQASSPG